MSHATKADKLLIKPTAGARPASPCTPGRFIAKARKRPDARRVTNGTDDTTLATAPDGPTEAEEVLDFGESSAVVGVAARAVLASVYPRLKGWPCCL
jgi:hypothetical protein